MDVTLHVPAAGHRDLRGTPSLRISSMHSVGQSGMKLTCLFALENRSGFSSEAFHSQKHFRTNSECWFRLHTRNTYVDALDDYQKFSATLHSGNCCRAVILVDSLSRVSHEQVSSKFPKTVAPGQHDEKQISFCFLAMALTIASRRIKNFPVFP